MPTWDNPLITIVTDKCRMCYACVRECPAKAIQVVDGQASVIQPRCIGCGNCLRVCSQNAKQVRDDTERTFDLLESDDRVAAIVAPSFPAEFDDMQPGDPGGDDPRARLRLRARDLAGRRPGGSGLPQRCYEENPDKRYITTPCPAVVSYVRKYHPRLMPNLAPDRLAHGGHGPGAAPRDGRRPQGRLHRPLRGQEAGLHRLHRTTRSKRC